MIADSRENKQNIIMREALKKILVECGLEQTDDETIYNVKVVAKNALKECMRLSVSTEERVTK